MPENQLAKRTHACVYICDTEGRVNVARSVSTSDTRHESTESAASSQTEIDGVWK